MAKERIPIPADVAAELEYRADRTCCVCREPRRPTQIHHIDDDPSNNNPENLAVLCLDHHHETQVSGGFARKLDAAQVRRYRDEWHRVVEDRRTRPVERSSDPPRTDREPDASHRLEHDRDIFRRAQEILSDRALHKFLDRLGDSDEYVWSEYAPLLDYGNFLAARDNQFLDPELTGHSSALTAAIDKLQDFLGLNFFPFGEPGTEHHVMHPRLNVDRGGDARGRTEYKEWQEKLDAVTSALLTAWREFRGAVKQVLIL